MIRIMIGLVASKLIPIGEGIIERVNNSNMIDEANVIGEANTKVTESEREFLIPRARLSFVKLRQLFSTALILHFLDPKYHIWINIDPCNYIISEVLN